MLQFLTCSIKHDLHVLYVLHQSCSIRGNFVMLILMWSIATTIPDAIKPMGPVITEFKHF